MTAAGAPGERLHVVIAGGGFAALETVLALRELAGERVSITVLAPNPDLVYRPVTVAEAFGRAEARSFRIGEILADQNAEYRRDSLQSVDHGAGKAITAAGAEIPYDALVIASGAVMNARLAGALTFRGRPDVPALKAVLADLESGAARSVAFTLPRGQTWPLPLYELTMLTAAYLRERGNAAAVHLVTPEEGPLALFGAAAEDAIRPMLEALQVRLRCQSMPSSVKEHELVLAGGGTIRVDRVVTMPELSGPHIGGLPADEHGFIPIDSHGRVSGIPGVYAAGDVTAFPLKQGGLATQQADAVAEVIAAKAGARITPRRFHPVLRGLLITSGAPVYLRCEPQRLERRTTVAINARRPAHVQVGASVASDQALWWPPAKIAGRYLAPYLATARPAALTAEPLTDRGPVAGPPLEDDEFADAVELALLLADGDADWGDYHSALAALDAAEALQGALPPEYETKRRIWLSELESQ
ncbi:MAG: FAD-dependent oxidoreductase [Solirubrobacteraceae bacterium]|jgi:sulfide:quinone oxidoreductase